MLTTLSTLKSRLSVERSADLTNWSPTALLTTPVTTNSFYRLKPLRP